VKSNSKAKGNSKAAWPKIRLVRHKNGAKAWLVDGRVRGIGERFFFKSKGEAETKADQLRTTRANEGLSAVNFPEKLRIEADECARALEPFGKTLRDAVNFYLPHLRASNRTCTFTAMTSELLDAKGRDGASKRYLGDLRSRLGQFGASVEGKSISAITATEVDAWLRSLAVAATTRNNFRRVLIVAFNFALNRGYCVTNPAEKSAKAKEVEGTVGILSIAQTVRLLDVAPVELVPFITLGAFAGLRRAELERLDWAEVDLQGGLIEVLAAKAKSARRRFVKIRENLAAWLQPIAKTSGTVTPSNYRDLMDTAREAAGITEWPQNAFRHGFASYHLAHFKDAASLALELGHTNANLVFQHYRQLVKPKDAERYWSIRPARVENVVAMPALA
jgi:integrase